MRPPGTPEQLEKRRRRAIAQVKAGHTLSAVARQLSASVSSVCRWWQVYQRDGHRGLRPRPTPGRPSKLSDAQKRTLVRLLGQGPLRAGYRTDLWTLGRVAVYLYCRPAISPVSTSRRASAICSAISTAPWTFSGTAAPSTAVGTPT